MNLSESCLWGKEVRLTPEELLRGFSNSHWWAFAALWWPHSLDSEKQRVGGGKRVEWFILPPCRSLWVVPLEIVSNVTVLRRKISTLCLSVQTYSAHARVVASIHFKAVDAKYPPHTTEVSGYIKMWCLCHDIFTATIKNVQYSRLCLNLNPSLLRI